jgi:hypothetical protein
MVLVSHPLSACYLCALVDALRQMISIAEDAIKSLQERDQLNARLTELTQDPENTQDDDHNIQPPHSAYSLETVT